MSIDTRAIAERLKKIKPEVWSFSFVNQAAADIRDLLDEIASLRAQLETARDRALEEAATIAEQFVEYTCYGREDVNDLMGMFARGNRNAKVSIAGATRALKSKAPPP